MSVAGQLILVQHVLKHIHLNGFPCGRLTKYQKNVICYLVPLIYASSYSKSVNIWWKHKHLIGFTCGIFVENERNTNGNEFNKDSWLVFYDIPVLFIRLNVC